MKKFIYSLTVLLYTGYCNIAAAQTETDEVINSVQADVSVHLNMDAIYNRPFLTGEILPLAIGGYMEINTQYEQTDGITDGFHFQARRFVLFFSSSVERNIRFLSEMAFEGDFKEINLEVAALDIGFHHLANLRAGIVQNPIGAFNQNHDGPRWDFIDRPILATNIIPSTLSNIGFGLYGKYFAHNWIMGYEAYLTNGFDEAIISNEKNRTSLADGKQNPLGLETNNSGLPMFTGKLAVRKRNLGELGVSYLTGVYNKWQDNGEAIEDKRYARILAVDFNTLQFNNRLYITGEIARVYVDVPATYTQQFGAEQLGAYIDIVGTMLERKILDWEKARLNFGLRLEYADYNRGKFQETGGNIADDVFAVVPGIAFRPSGTSVFRFNYRYQENRDLLGNPSAKTGVIQLGFSSYF